MRSLLITHTPIWPIRSGHSIRRSLIVDSLRRRGDVTVLLVPRGTRWDRGIDGPVETITAPLPARSLVGRRALIDLLVDRVPSEFVGYGWRDFGRSVAGLLRGRTFDLCWFDRPVSLLAARTMLGPISVCDLDDLEHVKLARKASLEGHHAPLERLKTRQRTAAWARLQATAMRLTDVGVVCTDVDAVRLGSDRVAVIPNCFPDPGLRSASPADPGPTVLLLGLHTYGPNADGAIWFAHDVLPILKARVPDVRIEIVGEAGGRTRALASDRVHVIGEVDDPSEAFQRATMLAVPIRYGSGSRLKILEAWARGVPVVSTSIGAEGLGATDGVELLVADEPDEFARASARVSSDPALVETLVRNGRRRYEQHHTPTAFDTAMDRALEQASAVHRARS